MKIVTSVFSNRAFIGIDPGESGGIAIISTVCDPIAYKMPATESEIYERLSWGFSGIKKFCMIEKVHSMPHQGVASTFSFGMSYGGLRMALIAAHIPFATVNPRTWQKFLGIKPRKIVKFKKGTKKGEEDPAKSESKTKFKNRVKAIAQELFPGIKITHKIADALLIGEYCRQVRSK